MAKKKRQAEDHPKSRPCVLKLKLGACLNAPTRRLHADLHEVSRQLDVARNAMARWWQRFFEDHPPPPGGFPNLGREGKPRLNEKDGSPLTLTPGNGGLRLPDDPRTLSARVYEAGTEWAPSVNSQLVVRAAGEVLKLLGSRTRYDHPGESRWTWEAVLSHEVNLSTFRKGAIPVPNSYTAICYEGKVTPGNVPKGLHDEVLRHGKSGCVVCFPLWGKASGRLVKHALVRLEARQLPPGHKNALREVAAGKWKLSDSKLVFRPASPNGRFRRNAAARGKEVDGHWELHLVYEHPATAKGPDRKRVAVLEWNYGKDAGKAIDHPFRVYVRDDPAAAWQVGRGPMMRQLFGRLHSRRRAMRGQSKLRKQARGGHGRGRNERDMQPLTRKINHAQNDFTARAAAEVVRFCERFDCGTLVWQEPALHCRGRTWFIENGVPWQWEHFAQRLKNECVEKGVVLDEGASKAATGT